MISSAIVLTIDASPNQCHGKNNCIFEPEHECTVSEMKINSKLPVQQSETTRNSPPVASMASGDNLTKPFDADPKDSYPSRNFQEVKEYIPRFDNCELCPQNSSSSDVNGQHNSTCTNEKHEGENIDPETGEFYSVNKSQSVPPTMV